MGATVSKEIPSYGAFCHARAAYDWGGRNVRLDITEDPFTARITYDSIHGKYGERKIDQLSKIYIEAEKSGKRIQDLRFELPEGYLKEKI